MIYYMHQTLVLAPKYRSAYPIVIVNTIRRHEEREGGGSMSSNNYVTLLLHGLLEHLHRTDDRERNRLMAVCRVILLCV